MAPFWKSLALPLAGVLATAWGAAAEAAAGAALAPPALRRSLVAPAAGTLEGVGQQSAGASPLALADGDDDTKPEDKKKDEDTTTPPEETTTPAPPQSADSIFNGMVRAVKKQLRSAEHQWVNALIAFAFGIVMVFDGEDFFKWIVIAVVFLLCSILAMSDLTEVWSLDSHSAIRHIVGLEVGAVGAYAAVLGFEGVVVVVAALLGGCMAFEVQQALIGFGATALETRKWLVVCLYTLFVAGAVVIFKRKKHVKGLAVLSALAGGALVSSAIMWSATALAVNGYLSFMWSAFPTVAPKGGPWLDFLLLLMSSNSTDYGIFAGSSYNFELQGETWRVDRIGGVALGAVFFVIGAMLQLKALKTKEAPAGKTALARELGASLLAEE